MRHKIRNLRSIRHRVTGALLLGYRANSQQPTTTEYTTSVCTKRESPDWVVMKNAVLWGVTPCGSC
jgi:hypothetical protein